MRAWSGQLGAAAAVMVAALITTAAAAADRLPNIVFILADDLGYGDLRAFNPDCKIDTPALDQLARDGMCFTDAHSSSSVCTPTRYSLLTGRYNWRSRLKSGVLGGMSPRLIEPQRMTVASLLARHGYHTAVIGKWHLGMSWALHDPAAGFDDTIEPGEHGWRADFTQPIEEGPLSVGFAQFFGIAGSLDMVPYTFIVNDRVLSVPTVDKSFPMMLGQSRGETRRGPAAIDFEATDVLPELTRQATSYVREHAEAARRGEPFFLYWPLPAPHTPIVPTPQWQSRSGLNPYADFVMQTDRSIGQLLETIEDCGLTEDTLVIFTSDNGCSPQADFPTLHAHGHRPSYHFRGHKADIYEGGHRVPFIVRCPGRVERGTQCDALVGLQDLLATCAALLETDLPADAGEDSISFLPLLSDAAAAPSRDSLVHHSIDGSFAIRQGAWKLCLCPGSGGWSAPRPGQEDPEAPRVQLFHLENDPGEQVNLADRHPEVVQQLSRLLGTIRGS